MFLPIKAAIMHNLKLVIKDTVQEMQEPWDDPGQTKAK